MDMESRTAPEVAEMLGIPEGTVRSRLRKGRQRFAKLAHQKGLNPEDTGPHPIQARGEG